MYFISNILLQKKPETLLFPGVSSVPAWFSAYSWRAVSILKYCLPSPPAKRNQTLGLILRSSWAMHSAGFKVSCPRAATSSCLVLARVVVWEFCGMAKIAASRAAGLACVDGQKEVKVQKKKSRPFLKYSDFISEVCFTCSAASSHCTVQTWLCDCANSDFLRFYCAVYYTKRKDNIVGKATSNVLRWQVVLKGPALLQAITCWRAWAAAACQCVVLNFVSWIWLVILMFVSDGFSCVIGLSSVIVRYHNIYLTSKGFQSFSCCEVRFFPHVFGQKSSTHIHRCYYKYFLIQEFV